jgi:hypothetical protein
MLDVSVSLSRGGSTPPAAQRGVLLPPLTTAHPRVVFFFCHCARMLLLLLLLLLLRGRLRCVAATIHPLEIGGWVRGDLQLLGLMLFSLYSHTLTP